MSKELTIIVLSFVIVGAFLIGSYVVISGAVIPSDKEVFFLVYGSLNTLAGGVMNYWFGTSKNSADKDAAIKTLTQEKPQ